ncbi:MAG: hypothetical protein ACKVQJ_02005 [Pyrinomonadaceae bacterium]
MRLYRSIFAAFLLVAGVFSLSAQVADPKPDTNPKKDAAKPSPTPDRKAVAAKPTTAEQVVETSLVVYGLGGGRVLLNQIRKTTLERGRSTYTETDGKVLQSTYQRFVIRGDKLVKEKIRLDQDFPNAKYSLVFNDQKIFMIYNNTTFTPREDAAKRFEFQIIHGIESLLRYKEDESSITMGEREKVMGVDYYVIDLTDKAERKTRYYISAKSFRVMMLTYEDGGVKYRRRFYDYNYAQGTLVPYRTVLWANDKIVEETDVGTVTFGQKVDEELFKAG